MSIAESVFKKITCSNSLQYFKCFILRKSDYEHQRGVLNFFEKVGTNEHSDESECEDCDTDVQSQYR